MKIVVDSSVIFGFYFKDEKNNYSEKLLKTLKENELTVPSIFYLEVSNVVCSQFRAGRWAIELLNDFTFLICELDIEVACIGSDAMSSVIDLALRYKLSTYDASYLYVAKSQNLQLATLDKALIKAAKKEGVYWQ